MKRLATVIVYNAIAWVWCSYVLAWCGRIETVQILSQTAITTILGVVISYAFKSMVENISQYGWRGKNEDAGHFPIQQDENNRDPN